MKALEAYAGLIKLALVAALVIGIVVWYNSRIEKADKAGYDRANAIYATQLAEAKTRALDLERQLNAQRDRAQTEGAKRDEIILTLAASVGKSSGSLHDTLTAIRNGVSSASIEALRDRTATLSTLLDSCQTEYGRLAAKADRHANDVQTHQEAWPVVPTPATPPQP